MDFSRQSTGPSALAGASGVGAIVGVSTWANRIRQDILGVAEHTSNVLITGPNGTGKEVIARAIHAQSRRVEKPFIPVDCASFVGSLFPSHMFGHVKGAFTGAEYAAMGCFRAADGGTLFMDEIGELELPLQAKLLRVLQERVVVPVGGVDGVSVDVRIVAATNRDLQSMVATGEFREDLFYRLNVVLLRSVPLRQRPDDVEVLAQHFLAAMADDFGLPLKQLSPQAARCLRDYHWPGNVRQLKNILERAVIYTEGEVIFREALAPFLTDDRPQASSDPPAADPPSVGAPPTAASVISQAEQVCDAADAEKHDWLSLEALESFHIQQTLDYTYHNQSAAARLLGTTPRILAGKIKKYGIDTSQSRRGRPSKHNRPAK